MRSLSIDVRHAWRRLRHSPAFTAIAVLMLTLGIGSSVAMFSVLQGVVLSGLPYPGGERVVAIAASNPAEKDSFARLTMAEAVRFADDREAFEAFGYYDWAGMTVLDGDRPREITINFVNDGFFPALGVAPLHGRTFTASDMDDADRPVVLSYVEWQRLTGGNAAAIGTTIDTASEGRFRIIGVMPPGFDYPIAETGAWRPFRLARLQSDQPGYRNARFLDGVGRFPVGVEASLALQRVQSVAHAVREDFGLSDAGWRITATPLLEQAVGQAQPALWASFAVSVLVLLIACANVAILLDARQIARRHEQAVTQAIGASRARVYRVMLIELLLLGGIGAIAGTLVAMVALEALKVMAIDSVPRADRIGLDGGVLAFALVLVLATPIFSALLGSLRLRGSPIDAMRSGGGKGAIGGEGRRTRMLPVVGVMLSTVGLFAAAAMVANLLRIQRVEPGFSAERVHALQIFRNGGPEEWRQFATEMRGRLSALPGVSDVGMTTAAPLSSIGNLMLEMRVAGRAEPEPMQANVRRVSAGYLDVLAIPLLAGRDISDSDRETTEPVAVINQALARRVFDGRDPVGQMIALPLGQGWREFRIVGVSGDVRNAGLRGDALPEILVPFAQSPWVGMTFLVRPSTELAGLPALMREALWAIDPRQATTREFLMRDELDEQLKPARFFMQTIGIFALCTLLLAALGVYAVAAQYQQYRRAEFGLRLAVGAPPLRLARQSLATSAMAATAGIVIGAGIGTVLLRLIESQLFGFGLAAYLPWLLLALAAMATAVLLAALPPALRAMRVDPMVALRND